MLYLKCRVLFCVQTAFVTVILIGDVLPRYLPDKYAMTKAQMTAMPWVGMLKYKDDNQFLTGMILIRNKLAIANAQDVSKIDKKKISDTIEGVFLTADNQAWYCSVTNYTLHPEFNEDTLNTLALLNLEYEDEAYKGDLMDWPRNISAYIYSDVFLVGLSHSQQMLEQVVYRMKYVNLTDCINFYIDEKLDSMWMRPTHYMCYRSMFSKEPCVYENGMALAANVSGKWTLLGLSTWGPGCALPARFINFASFTPWVVSSIASRRRDEKDDERVHLKKDDYIYVIEKIAENEVAMRPSLEHLTEAIGACGEDKTRDEFLMYHDEAVYQVEDYGFGIYTFSIYDLHFNWEWNCISIKAGSGIFAKSQAEVKKTEGFGKGLGEQQRLEKFIKIYPIIYPPMTRKPKVMQHIDMWDKYDTIDVRNIHFRFYFFEEATVKLMIYGNRIPRDRVTRTYKTYSYKAANATFKRRKHTVDTYPTWATKPMSTYTFFNYDPNRDPYNPHREPAIRPPGRPYG